MKPKRRQAPLRRCAICRDQLYPDERPTYCQDCRALVHRLAGGTKAILVPPAYREQHERKIAAHAERVAKGL